MAIRPDKTLQLILEHKDPFLEFVDAIDENLVDSQIPIPLYTRKISAVAARLIHNEAMRIRDALSLENLYRNGFLLDWNRKDGHITFKPWLVEMLRHLDTARLKELSDKDLESLRGQLANVDEQFSQEGLVAAMGNPDFVELVALLFDTLNTVNDRLQQNVRSLDSQSLRLSQILDAEDITALNCSQQMTETLARVRVLRERHIKPMLQFIDQNEIYKDKRNPMAIIERLGSRMQGLGYPELAGRVVNARISMISLTKKVKAIGRLLDRYIRQDKEERHRYNRIEEHFNALLDACRGTLRDGNRRTRLVPSAHPVFENGAMFLGLKSHSQTNRQVLSWKEEGRYSAFLEEKGRSYRESTRKWIDTAEHGGAYGNVELIDHERLQREAQTRRLLDALQGFSTGQREVDMHNTLHEFLIRTLNGYSLGDLVEATSLLKASGQVTLTYRREMNTLEYDGYRLRYLSCSMEPLV